MQQNSPHSQAYLIIQLGSHWTDILRLQAGQTASIGRSSENQIVVRDEQVSRRHAEISHHNGGWQIEDLGSRNGTQVAGDLIAEPHQLQSGQRIVVGGCQITFSETLANAFPGVVNRDANGTLDANGTRAAVANLHAPEDGSEATSEPTIVSRLSRSHWSAEIDPSEIFGPTASPLQPSPSETWGFFYRLVFDLVNTKTAEQAAGIAIDRLLAELGISSGGVVQIDQQPTCASTGSPSAPDLNMAVLAVRQSPGQTYHRISDYLVQAVLRDQQAVLARNIQDDEQLSLARASGQHETTSVLCAPLRLLTAGGEESIVGLLHIYTQHDERMLTPDDLHLAVGVADNLAIALTHLQTAQHLANELDASRRKVQQLETELEQTTELVGRSAAMQLVKQSIQRAAPSEATILIRGESGVGKELVARAIHTASARRESPLVCLNCAALAPTLLESELFGHEKGSFTGATERKIGKFEAAHRGTLFLDEIGELPIELQSKFLRALEGHPFERLGGNNPIHADVRVLAATNRDLEDAVRNKEFRSDLYFRLRVIEIPVPPLRGRPDDIPELVEHFLRLLKPHAHRRLVGVEPAVLEKLARHRWPGNVRELRNVIERAIVLGTGSTIGIEDLNLAPIFDDIPTSGTHSPGSFEPIALEELEKKHIMAVLEYAQGNKSKAAQLLGIERSTLDRKLKRFNT